jgi:hypothetical protein
VLSFSYNITSSTRSSSSGFPTSQHHTFYRSPRFNPEDIAHYLLDTPDDFRVLRTFKQPSLAHPNITMTYNYHRHQTLCRLGVEQLPSLCDPEMPASMRNKCEYDGRPAPVSGDLPVRSVPVSPPVCHFSYRITILTKPTGPRPQMPCLHVSWSDRLGDSRQALPAVWY